METTDPLYKDFLQELDALERFRLTYAALRPEAGLLGDDPDVRRLIEALALFSARTRRAASRSIDQSMRRIFMQHFSYLCDPMPAMAMLRATPDGRMADAAYIPSGARILVRPHEKSVNVEHGTRPLMFTTLRELRVLPVVLEEVAIFRKPAGGYRLLFHFEGGFFRNDAIERVSLYVNYLNDFAASLQVLSSIQDASIGAGVLFGELSAPEEDGAAVTLRVGCLPEREDSLELFDHPAQRVRSVLHYPQQAAYLHFDVPDQPRNWQEFTLYVDLDPSFVVPPRMSAESFALYTVPVANLFRAHTDVMVEDGTQDRHGLCNPDASGRFVYHSLCGVYRIGEEALLPLNPGVIDEVDESYELELENSGSKRAAYVRVQLADAFADPARLTAEALWHQPALNREPLGEDAQVVLLDRVVEGAQWGLLGAAVTPADNAELAERDALLQLLSIKNQRFLDRANMTLLLRALGVGARYGFLSLIAAVADVRVESKPYGRGSRGFKYIYHVEMGPLDGGQLPLLELFATQLLSLLTCWSIEEVVELQLRVPNLEVVRCYT